MRIKVSEQSNATEKFNKIAEFYDESCYAALFIQELLDIAYEDGKTKILIEVDFPEMLPFSEGIDK